MGYASILWYVIAAIAFFIPFSIMMAEYGAAFKDEHGGIYSWMQRSMNEKYAFIATFMWYIAQLMWLITTSAILWIPISDAIFGADTTATWKLFNFSPTQTLTILALIWVFVITLFAVRGIKPLSWLGSIGGIATIFLTVLLVIGSLLVFASNNGQFAQTITFRSFFVSPNKEYISPISVYIIFSFCNICI